MYPNHPDPDVADAFRRLSNALVQWERATGLHSLLIFREGNSPPGECGPSDRCIRLDNGIPVDPANADLSDAFLLARFSDTDHGQT